MSNVKIEDVCNICTDLLIEKVTNLKSIKIKRKLPVRSKKSDNTELDSDKNNVNPDPNSEIIKILSEHRSAEKISSKCKLCEICDLSGQILIFKDLEFIDFLDSNDLFDGDLTDFNIHYFFKHFKVVETSPSVSPFLNKYNVLNGLNPLDFRNKILKGLNYYVICLYLLSDKNHTKFQNEIVLKAGGDLHLDFPDYFLHFNRLSLVETRLKRLVLDIFLRELSTVDQSSVLFRNFKKLQENHLLFAQLIQIKPYVRLTNGEYYLTISRNKISFIGYYNKFQRNISQTDWYLDRSDIMSVEKCIGLPLKKILNAQEYKLIGAGREDVNVRNLGNGRKAALELKNLTLDPFLLLYAIDFSEADFPNRKDSNPTDPVTLYHHNMEIDKDKITLADKKLIKDYFTRSHKGNPDTAKDNSDTLEDNVEDNSDTVEDNSDTVEDNSDTVEDNSDTVEDNSDTVEDNVEDNVEEDVKKVVKKVKDNAVVTFKNVRMSINCRIERRLLHSEIETHCKSYSCLIFSEGSLTFDMVKTLITGLQFPLLIKQKNPLRISHRRSQDTRERLVLDLKLNLIHPKLLLMYIKTTAGLYIKEFVNGDLGRTLPNLSKMLNTKLYPVSLDVLDIT
ncbi:putative tRNA pseudouridine synthase Pus10 [Theileria parva strain Muguga]|uniref:tRNA pseudouridine(55) synthase n=1 Tax=Theileria parva TaxID=5875 RepID=Q4N8D5_THEPA|nr:putative tRNA pseudouridine synthase Pus10 [Theileria parva strain Muguga]EAN33773.1 putative tRNA pseudouridine synthase Pus10 [Theileria parva strain Muguga]|eukprot:XP_766056.1 hypothetical protein [Theileria parva strain Muguga]